MAQPSTKDSLMKEAEDALHKFDNGIQAVEQNVKDVVKATDKVIIKESSAFQGFLENILGGQERFWVRGPVDGQRLTNNMLGWGAFGIAVHAWHRGIQQRPLTRNLRPYFIAFPIWSLLGYYIHHFELRQEELLEHRHFLLKRNRRLLEDKDFDNLPLTQAFKEKRDARLKAEADARGPSLLEKVEAKLGFSHDTPTSSKDKMEEYNKRLQERLEKFEKDLEASRKAKREADEKRAETDRDYYLRPDGSTVSFIGERNPEGLKKRFPESPLNPAQLKDLKTLKDVKFISSGDAVALPPGHPGHSDKGQGKLLVPQDEKYDGIPGVPFPGEGKPGGYQRQVEEYRKKAEQMMAEAKEIEEIERALKK